MAYLKINNIDFSLMVSGLEVNDTVNYNAQTNAAGNTVVDYINRKKTIKADFIPLTNNQMWALQDMINKFSVSITYLNPATNALDSINCIIPAASVRYYTIQADKVLFNACSLEFIEL